MHAPKKSWRNVLYIFILLAGVFLLFRWYSAANSKRIENQNLNYAMDSAWQTAQRIDSEFTNAQRRVRNYAYFLSEMLNEPNIDTELLQELEENSDFDALRFTNSEGLNLTSDGSTSYSTDRNYFLSGMQGESGSTVVLKSRITDKAMMEQQPRRGLSNATRKNRDKARHMSLGYVLFLVLAMCVAGYVLIHYIQLQADITTATERIASQEKELNNLKVANDEELSRITSSVDMEEVKRVAIGELGMVYPQEGQIITYTNEGKDYVRKVDGSN